MDNLEKNLKNFGVAYIRYYYNNCILVGNIFTVCLLFSEEGKILSRGVSICSIIDFHSKKDARKNSMSRAISALVKKKNSLEILPKADDSRFIWDIQKRFKIKTNEIKTKLLDKINELGFDYILRKSGTYEMLYVKIPYIYSVLKTKEYFKFKSEYAPEPTSDEKQVFKKILK